MLHVSQLSSLVNLQHYPSLLHSCLLFHSGNRKTKLGGRPHKGEQLPFMYSPSNRCFSFLRIESFHLYTDPNPLFSFYRTLLLQYSPFFPYYPLSPQRITPLYMRGSVFHIQESGPWKQSAGIGILPPPCSRCMAMSLALIPAVSISSVR